MTQDEKTKKAYQGLTGVFFGKYYGDIIGEVEMKDPGYIDWLAREAYEEHVKEAAQAMIDLRPEVAKMKRKDGR